MAAVEVVIGTPLAEALQNLVQPKLSEVGWSTGADDSALSEYIILMLVNGKTQDQIASELSNDLLGLGPEDSGAIDFSRWLFEQVQVLNAQLNGGAAPAAAPTQPAETHEIAADAAQQDSGMDGASGEHDADMGDVGDGAQGSIPTGPKAMRNGKTRDKRMLGQLNKAMDRSGDAALHRVRTTTGTGRINTHAAREPPKGPRSQQIQRGMAMANNRPMNAMPMPNMGPGGPMMPQGGLGMMTPEQQMQFYKLLEQQAQMMAMFASQGAVPGGPAINPAFQNPMPSPAQQGGKSLFDRVQGKGPRQNGSFQNRRQQQQQQMGSAQNQGDTVMSGDAQTPTTPLDSALTPTRNPSETVCKFNLACTKPDCPFVHQSPAAPPNIAIDMSDTCSFGAACKNHKCVGKHPSPAQRTLHQAEQDCKYWPNCTNPHCPFRHPSVAPCRNGADCSVPGCTFWHNPTMCKYDPCTNAACPYKHAEGQKRGRFADKVWQAGGEKKPHVSERKFVEEDGEEELILPGSGDSQADGVPVGEPQTQAETQVHV